MYRKIYSHANSIRVMMMMTVDSMLSASGNLFKCHEEVLYLQPLIPTKRFDIFSPITGGCSEGLGVL